MGYRMNIDPEEAKRRSRGISKDMSPAAIEHRLDIASELYLTARELARGAFVEPESRPGSPRQASASGPADVIQNR